MPIVQSDLGIRLALDRDEVVLSENENIIKIYFVIIVPISVKLFNTIRKNLK